MLQRVERAVTRGKPFDIEWWECAVRINGRSVVRACMEPAVQGLKIETCLDVGNP